MPTDHRADTIDQAALAGEAARSLFSKFRALLEANTAALATMARMERMLGGEYIFDRAFMERSAREVADFAHQAVYAVNAMTDNRYVALYDRFMTIDAAVEDILAGRLEVNDERPVRPVSRLRLEDLPKAGEDAAILGELADQLGVNVSPAFVVSRTAWRDGNLSPAGRRAVAAAVEEWGDVSGTDRVSVALTALGEQGAAYLEIPDVPPRAEAVLATLEELTAVLRKKLAENSDRIHFRAWVMAKPPTVFRGRLTTCRREADGRAFVGIEVWPEDDVSDCTTLLLDRFHPFAVRRVLPDGRAPRQTPLSRETVALLAGQGLAAERLLGAWAQFGFRLDDAGGPAFESARLLACELPAPAPEPAPEDILLSGGEAACLGIASGQTVPVDEATSADAFPFGAIAVARSASPALAPILRRAGAMVAEVGDAAGHLAAVAREFRVPALFGVPGALAALGKGLVVTVDAEAGCVLRGAMETRPASETGLSPEDAEYLTLRRLLRRVATLSLTDPEAPEFSVSGCRSLHDILHFAHDRAVAELADLRRAGISGHLARPLPLPVPLDLRILDIGGGLVPGATGLAAVGSRPLAALLAGMLTPGMWDTTPASVGLGEIFGGMHATMTALSTDEAATGGNLAIAARSYCNVSLRLGYHFTVIDAYLGPNPEKNTIYFRYVGGLANAAGREQRALFMQRVLGRFEFKVELAGDLLVARLKLVELATAEAALRLLGRLCAFARQRDTGQPDAAALEEAFFAAEASAGSESGVKS